jgi:hypothetical protein
VRQLEFRDGTPVYCDSCHSATTVFLHRQTEERPNLIRYMQSEYVDQLRRRDGAQMGCTTCHGFPVNFRFLPRLAVPEGLHPPPAGPGPRG